MDFKPNSRYLYLVVLSNIIPHFFNVPSWAVAMALTFLVWKMTSEVVAIPVPNRWFNLVIAALCSFFVFNHFGTFLGDEAGTTLLLLMTCLKLFELRNYRDAMFLSYLCYFLLMSKLIASQGVGTTVFMVVDVILITGLLVSHHFHRQQGAVGAIIKRTSRLTLQAIPLALLVFFLFPRFSTGFWSRPGSHDVGKMGFSDHIKPGSIAQLVSSDEVAFRARFAKGETPVPSDIYWRGVVLEEGQGLNWTVRDDRREVARHEPVEMGRTIVEIYMEPSNMRWLFTLDWPEAVSFSTERDRRLLAQYTGRMFATRVPLTNRELYRVYSQTVASQVAWGRPEIERNLRLKVDEIPQTKKLVEGWHLGKVPPAVIVKKILHYFAQSDLRYTLTPKSAQSLDDFLFNSKLGFCEHFAGAMATMLRVAGVPARVVAGFQGGSPSLLDDYLTVRFQDAHAWVEYFDPELGTWIRVDPTAVIAPDRLAMGGQRYFDRISGSSEALFGRDSPLQKMFGEQLISMYFRGRMVVDQAEAAWINFLLRYDFSYQQKLFESLGFGPITRGGLLLMLVVVICVFALLYSLRLKNLWEKKDPAVELYTQLCRKLEQAGLKREFNEGPLQFSRRVFSQLPKHQPFLMPFFDAYISARYGGKPLTSEEAQHWHEQIRRQRFRADQHAA